MCPYRLAKYPLPAHCSGSCDVGAVLRGVGARLGGGGGETPPLLSSPASRGGAGGSQAPSPTTAPGGGGGIGREEEHRPSLEVGLWGRPRSELSFLNQAPWSELVTPSYLYSKYIQCREKGGLNSMTLSCSPLVHPYPLAWGAVLFQKGLVGMKGKGHVQRQVGLGDRIPRWLLHLCFWCLCAL